MLLFWKIKDLYTIKKTNKISRKMLKESKGRIYDLHIIVPKETLWEIIYNSIKRSIRIFKRKLNKNIFEPSLEKIIDEDFSDDRIHKMFFKNVIGKHFRFNGKFFEYMENNKGILTYKDAVEHFNLMYKIKTIEKKALKKLKEKRKYNLRQYLED